MLVACSPPDEDPEHARSEAESDVAVNDSGIPVDTMIRLERTVCYGSCPSYVLTIDAAGTVSFHGRKWVEHVGDFEYRMGTAGVVRLLSSFEAADFSAFKDSYRSHEDCSEYWTDNPTVTLELTSAGQTKQVSHYRGCRGFDNEEALIRLSDIVDERAGTHRWIGSGVSPDVQRMREAMAKIERRKKQKDPQPPPLP